MQTAAWPAHQHSTVSVHRSSAQGNTGLISSGNVFIAED